MSSRHLNFYPAHIRPTSLQAFVQRCSVKKMFLEISQNSQENTCASLFFNKVAKRLWHRCFPVNFVNILRAPFYTEHL